MKILIAMSLAVVLAGCGVEVLTTTAIEGKLQAEQLKAVNGQVQNASDSMAKVNIQRAIDTFCAEKGHYPASLDELAPTFIPSVPKRPDGSPYGYDAKTGKVLDAPAPAAALAPAGPPQMSDGQKIANIRAAMDRYGKTVGYYPPTLQALVPTYLAEVPKTASGQDFVYNCQNGALSVPGQPPILGNEQAMRGQGQPQGRGPNGRVQGAPQRRGPGGGGGAGPMGEVMTGIGVQQQLNGMGSSGADRAGSYSREKLGAQTQQHNAQQEKALNDLGL